VEKLLSLSPSGIVEIVVTAVISRGDAKVQEWQRAEMKKQVDHIVRRLSPVAKCRARLEVGRVGDELARVLKEEGAELMILGAQGHGFLERFVMGSVSLEQAVKRPYSVLVLKV